MADYAQYIYEVELVLSLETDYTVTHTDWYEWRENAMKTFLERLRTEIEGDATISAYLDEVVVIQEDDLDRFDVETSLKKNLVVIHTPREEIDETGGGSGRNDHLLECDITVYVRHGGGLDANHQEVLLIGDGAADHPGVFEIIEDLQTLLRNNFLSSGGEKYLWWVELGPVTPPENLDELDADINKATMTFRGRKWDLLW